MIDLVNRNVAARNSISALLDGSHANSARHKDVDAYIFGIPYFALAEGYEYYISDTGTKLQQRRKIGSLLVALSEMNTEKYASRGAKICNALSAESRDIRECLSSFVAVVCSEYEYLEGLHRGLADYFVADTFMVSRMNYDFSCDDLSELNYWNDVYARAFYSLDVWKEFDAQHFARVFDDDALLNSKHFSSFFRYLCNKQYDFNNTLGVVSASINYILDNTLVRNNDMSSTPIQRYFEFRNNISKDDKDKKETAYDCCVEQLKKHLYNPVFTSRKVIIHDEAANKYDPYCGYRRAEVYGLDAFLHAALAEIAHMSVHGMELACCKNCGRLFIPLVGKSKFCDRPIDGDEKHACIDISSRWYAQQRRIENPVLDEYTRYRTKYSSRTSRSKLNNPPERLAQWTERASQLINDCEAGTITMDEFSLILKEMDKEMKPLDKLKKHSGS